MLHRYFYNQILINNSFQDKIKRTLATVQELEETINKQTTEHVNLRQKLQDSETRYKHLNEYKDKLEQRGI